MSLLGPGLGCMPIGAQLAFGCDNDRSTLEIRLIQDQGHSGWGKPEAWETPDVPRKIAGLRNMRGGWDASGRACMTGWLIPLAKCHADEFLKGPSMPRAFSLKDLLIPDGVS